ncbi:MAG: hypothetical protein JNL67_16410 [Planctomycetaceae bacterium]|nr:hypothetical protein [Planctomycetaceae bacterium]
MSLAQLTDAELDELNRQCTEVINSVLSRLERDERLQAAFRRLLQTLNMMEEIQTLESNVSELVLQSAVAVLINSQSIKAIEVEQHRRMVERN